MEFPPLFVREMQRLLGDAYPAFATALSQEPPVSIRTNPYKTTTTINDAWSRSSPIPWCDDGYYLEKRPSFTSDPLFHAGCYYVQEASSMFLEQIIRQYVTEPAICLDLCAAPGGKSTLLSAVLPQNSLLVANELIRSRAHILVENLMKWGNPATIVTQQDPEEVGHIRQLFDVILADLPCSGEGMFRKNLQAIQEWSPANVKLCAARQQRIISHVWPALKPGGILIYSTCTFNTLENEENIRWMRDAFGATPLPVDLRPEWKITGSLLEDIPVFRFFPHLTKGEGFFIAVVRKPVEETSIFPSIFSSNKKVKKNKAPVQHIPEQVSSYICSPEQYRISLQASDIIAFPALHEEVYRRLNEKFRILSAGIRLGEIKGKDIIPHHALAMSIALNPAAFPSCEVDESIALQYLSREAIHAFPQQLPRTYVLLTYQKHPLGFVKNIGTRANNMYPQEWRIRNKRLPLYDSLNNNNPTFNRTIE
ncbi:MAG: RsmB/NOP family class I SAM-dependent RNA methyltransferase [Dysgonamonadaceae bacterium]|nr:RsmB/NOP family class I SAM-dependent RNA methyltransferase [Dysgonamonadaceae bacterium]